MERGTGRPDAATPTPGPSRIEEMSETGVPLLAPLGGEATTLLPPDHDAPTPNPEIQIDPRLPTGFYYVREVFSESQEETVKNVPHDNTWHKYHGRSVQHFGHACLGPGKVTATSPIPEEFSSVLQTYNAALERLGLSHPPPNRITGTMYLPKKASATTGMTPCWATRCPFSTPSRTPQCSSKTPPTWTRFASACLPALSLSSRAPHAMIGTTVYPDGGKTRCLG